MIDDHSGLSDPHKWSLAFTNGPQKWISSEFNENPSAEVERTYFDVLNLKGPGLNIQSYWKKSPTPEMVDLYIGPTSTHFRVHKELLCVKVPYFYLMFNSVFIEAQENKATFPEDNSQSFGLLVQWLYEDQFRPLQLREFGNGTACYSWNFVRFYRLADKLCLNSLMNQIMDSLRRCDREGGSFMEPKLVAEAYKYLGEGCKMRKYAIKSLQYSSIFECLRLNCIQDNDRVELAAIENSCNDSEAKARLSSEKRKVEGELEIPADRTNTEEATKEDCDLDEDLRQVWDDYVGIWGNNGNHVPQMLLSEPIFGLDCEWHYHERSCGEGHKVDPMQCPLYEGRFNFSVDRESYEALLAGEEWRRFHFHLKHRWGRRSPGPEY